MKKIDEITKDEMRKLGYLWEFNGEPSSPHALLASGKHSGVFINATLAIHDPYFLPKVLDFYPLEGELAQFHCPESEIIICPGYGAVALASYLSSRLKIPWGFTDKNSDSSGPWRHVLRRFDVKNKRVLVCEDVFTTGGSLAETCETVLRAGGILRAPLVLFNRSGVDHIDHGDISLILINIFHVPLDAHDPKDCPYCKMGSEALKPKLNWSKFMEFNIPFEGR
jgi:orotate phosphoribosyltransferase